MSAKLDIITTFMKEFGCGSIDKALDTLTEDAQWAIVQTSRGTTLAKGELNKRLQMMRGAFENGQLLLTPISCVEQGDDVAVEFISSAETVLGGSYRNKYAIFFKFAGDKIADVREYNDSLHITEVLAPAIIAQQSR